MRRLTWLLRLLGVVLAGALFVSAVVVAVAPRVWQIANAHIELPTELPSFEPLAQRSFVYDLNGQEIAIFERENVQPFTIDQVPQPVIQAVLAVEDKEFYSHKGVNVRSMIRATLSNFSSGANVQGASTITQQVVKNEFLAGLARDGRYKLLQIHYGLMLDKKLPKDKILERYLNTVFLGNNAYGLAAAAETYFGVSVQELTLVQGAFLAGLIRSPSGYDPILRPERARARFEQVLDRLVDQQMIDNPQRIELLRSWPIPERVQVLPGRVTTPTYFTEALQDYLLNRSSILGDDEQARRSTLLRGGLRIYTTLDPAMQAKAEYARAALPVNAQGFDAAMISLDTKSGAIRVMVGGKGFKRNISEINMALIPRQTGSSIKVFILAAALQAGATANDLIDGTKPCELPDPENPGGPPFIIEDAVNRPVSTLSVMTAASINCAFGKLSQIVGLHRVVDTTYRMAHSPYLDAGMDPELREPIHPYGAFATGANEMSALDMASGAQTISNQGLHHDPYFVERIERADGSSLYEHFDEGTQVLDPGVALTEVSMLKGVLVSGTGRKYPLANGRPGAGKTGTYENNTNATFVGMTPELATAVWVGNPNGSISMNGVPEFTADGVPKVLGGTYPAKIWKLFTDAALDGQPLQDWPAPPPPARPPLRLYLPGVECLAKLVSGSVAVATTTTTIAPAEPPPDGSVPVVAPRAPVVYRTIPTGTTIPRDIVDPLAPMPTIDPKGIVVYDCKRGIPGASVKGG